MAGAEDHVLIGTAPGATVTSSLYALFCNGRLHSYIWVERSDVIDLDAAAAAEAQRYVEDVVRPVITIGANPDGRGLAGLASWFWIEGFTGSVTAPPISAYGLTVEVRMSSGSITWDFGDGAVEPGDLGHAYPAESTVQHRHQSAGTYSVTATIDLRPEYRVDGGSWITLPALSTAATTTHVVEQRQAVITDA